jgi:hypothetical protein
MPSFTSSSEERSTARGYWRPICAALATLVLLLGAFEAATRVGFARISRIESRTYREYRGALGIRRSKSVLLLGNSLLLEGVDLDRLRALLQPEMTPTRFVVEQTDFADWYYGVRRLLAEGSRPDRIVLCLDTRQLISNTLRGDYSAYYLIQTADLVEAGRNSGYNLTQISGLFFARYSLFYAGSGSFRNYVLNQVDRPYADILRKINEGTLPPVTEADFLAKACAHLERLQSVCSRYGARCDILLPPGFAPPGVQASAVRTRAVEAGKRTGTSVFVPVALNAWGSEMFRDGYHLNPMGAREFTDLVADSLRRRQ